MVGGFINDIAAISPHGVHYQTNDALQGAVILLGALQGAPKDLIIRSWGYQESYLA